MCNLQTNATVKLLVLEAEKPEMARTEVSANCSLIYKNNQGIHIQIRLKVVFLFSFTHKVYVAPLTGWHISSYV